MYSTSGVVEAKVVMPEFSVIRLVGLRMAGAGKQVRWCSYFFMIVVCEEHAANTTDSRSRVLQFSESYS